MSARVKTNASFSRQISQKKQNSGTNSETSITTGWAVAGETRSQTASQRLPSTPAWHRDKHLGPLSTSFYGMLQSGAPAPRCSSTRCYTDESVRVVLISTMWGWETLEPDDAEFKMAWRQKWNIYIYIQLVCRKNIYILKQIYIRLDTRNIKCSKTSTPRSAIDLLSCVS